MFIERMPPTHPSATPEAHSLKETATVSTSAIQGATTSFSERFRDSMKASDTLGDLRGKLHGFVSESETWMDGADTFLMASLGIDPNEIKGRRVRTAEARDNYLRDDYNAVEDFYETIAGFLRDMPEGQEKMTRSEFAKLVLKFIGDKITGTVQMSSGNRKLGLYITDNFADGITAITDSDDISKVNGLADALTKKIEDDSASIQGVPPNLLRERAFLALRPLQEIMGWKQTMMELSKEAILGMLGRVPDAAKRARIFDDAKKISSIKPGKFYSVEVDTGGKTYELYVGNSNADGTKQVEPAELYQDLLDRYGGEIRSRVVGTHVRLDADVVKLFKDMSDNASVKATLRESGVEVGIFGISGSDEFNVVGLPAGIDETDFKKHPMKYIKHHFHYFRTSQTENALNLGPRGTPPVTP